MLLRRLLEVLSGGVVLLATALSHAQCTKDTDCKGQRVCEGGQCVAGRGVAPPAAAAAPAPSPADAPATTPPPEAPPAQATPPEGWPPAAGPADSKPRMQRHSTGMMVGGIVMVSLAPVALVVSGFAAIAKGICEVDNDDSFNSCDNRYNPTIYGSLVSALVLVGVGIPLIVVGAKKEPVDDSSATATISPWAAPSAAGLQLRIDM